MENSDGSTRLAETVKGDVGTTDETMIVTKRTKSRGIDNGGECFASLLGLTVLVV